MPKPLKPTTDLVNNRQLDTERIVTMLMFEGKGTGQIAKELSTTKSAVEQHISKAKTRDMIQKAHEDRMELVMHIPIANYANRLRRLENILLDNSDDPKLQLACLKEAREETKAFFREEEAEEKAPQITVNIQRYEGSEEGVLPRAVAEARDAITSVKVTEGEES